MDPRSPFLQVGQYHVSQCFLTREILLALDHLCGFALDSLQKFHLTSNGDLRNGHSGLTRLEWKGRVTSLNLQAKLFFMHTRIPLAFLASRASYWLAVNPFTP